MPDAPTSAEIAALLAQWSEWLEARTDALLSLEDRVRSAGTKDDAADVAAAFVCRKAITDRLDTVRTTAANDRSAAVALTTQPLVDELGGAVGSNLTDAATLLDAIVHRVEKRVAAREGEQLDAARTAAQADTDLTVAARLAESLGMQINHVADLRDRLTRRIDVAEVAKEAGVVRSSLEAADRERTTLLAQWAAVPARLEALTAVEQRVRQLAARCREKVMQAPPLAVPSIATFDEVELGDVSGLTWAAARGRVTPTLVRLDRVAAALAEAERRFQEPLDRREELRGLLQSFADKASANGVMEEPGLDALFREAKDVLWAAPCDLQRGGVLVDHYVAAVNAKVKGVAR